MHGCFYHAEKSSPSISYLACINCGFADLSVCIIFFCSASGASPGWSELARGGSSVGLEVSLDAAVLAPAGVETVGPGLPLLLETVGPGLPLLLETVGPGLPLLLETVSGPGLPLLLETVGPGLPLLLATVGPGLPLLLETVGAGLLGGRKRSFGVAAAGRITPCWATACISLAFSAKSLATKSSRLSRTSTCIDNTCVN